MAYLQFYCDYCEYYGFIALMSLGDREELRETETKICLIIYERTMMLLRYVQDAIADGIESRELFLVDPRKTVYAFWEMMDRFILMYERYNVRIIRMSLEELVADGLDTAFLGILRWRQSL